MTSRSTPPTIRDTVPGATPTARHPHLRGAPIDLAANLGPLRGTEAARSSKLEVVARKLPKTRSTGRTVPTSLLRAGPLPGDGHQGYEDGARRIDLTTLSLLGHARQSSSMRPGTWGPITDRLGRIRNVVTIPLELAQPRQYRGRNAASCNQERPCQVISVYDSTRPAASHQVG